MIGYDENGESFYGCSGTLVSPTVFVTAAHCTGGEAGVIPTTVRVTFGPQIPLNGEGIPEPTLSIAGDPFPNPAFWDDDNFFTFEQISADYGVVVLDQPATDIFPDVTIYGLPTRGFLDRRINKDKFTLVGYGDSASETHLKDHTFDGLRRFAIVKANGGSLASPSVLLLRANPNGSSTTDGTGCSGDSGGATFDGATLVAVISPVDRCIHKTYTARLDVQPAIDFLSQFVNP